MSLEPPTTPQLTIPGKLYPTPCKAEYLNSFPVNLLLEGLRPRCVQATLFFPGGGPEKIPSNLKVVPADSSPELPLLHIGAYKIKTSGNANGRKLGLFMGCLSDRSLEMVEIDNRPPEQRVSLYIGCLSVEGVIELCELPTCNPKRLFLDDVNIGTNYHGLFNLPDLSNDPWARTIQMILGNAQLSACAAS